MSMLAKTYNKANHGFTLIELMVSIAIIGILSSLSIAMFQSYRTKSFDSRAIAQTRSALLSLTITQSENPDWICGFLTGFDNTIIGYGGGSQSIEDCLPGFTQDPEVIVQPSMNQDISPNGSLTVFSCSRHGSIDNQGNRYWAFVNTQTSSNISMVPSTHQIPGDVGTIKQHYDHHCIAN